jgi:hypothetical protein
MAPHEQDHPISKDLAMPIANARSAPARGARLISRPLKLQLADKTAADWISEEALH